jgi:hypothetical protein
MWELVTTALVTIQVIVAAAELLDKVLHRRARALPLQTTRRRDDQCHSLPSVPVADGGQHGPLDAATFRGQQ